MNIGYGFELKQTVSGGVGLLFPIALYALYSKTIENPTPLLE
jgi:hypothetical protein